MDQRWCLGNKKINKVEKNLYPNQIAQRVVDSIKEGINENDWVVWLPGWPSWRPLADIQELVQEIQLLKKMAEEAPPLMPTALVPPPPPLEVIQAAEDKLQIHRKQWESRKPETVISVESTAEPQNSLETNQSVKIKIESANSKVQPNDGTQSSKADAVVQIVNVAKIPSVPVKPNSGPDHNGDFANKRKHKRIFVRFRCIIRSTTLTFRTFTKDISLGGVALEDEIPSDLVGSECTIYITSPKANKNLKFKIALTGRGVPKYFSFQDVEQSLIDELGKWLDEHEQDSTAA